MGLFDDLEKSRKKAEEAAKAAEHANFVAQCRGRQHHDNADAAAVQSIRETGKAVGQPKVYEKRVQKLLKERGY